MDPPGSPWNLCAQHTARHRTAFKHHFSKSPSVREFDSNAVSEKAAESWFATWVQMVDLEMQNELKAPPEPAKSSYFTYPKVTVPAHATKAGQAALKIQAKEQDLLESQLAMDVADYARGRRMELEYELREKRKKK